MHVQLVVVIQNTCHHHQPLIGVLSVVYHGTSLGFLKDGGTNARLFFNGPPGHSMADSQSLKDLHFSLPCNSIFLNSEERDYLSILWRVLNWGALGTINPVSQ